MKAGKISQAIMKRSVLKQLHPGREEILSTPSAAEKCTVMKAAAGKTVVSAAASASGRSENVGIYAVAKAVNEIAVRGAVPVGVSLQIVLEPHVSEPELKEMVRAIEIFCSGLPVAVTCVQVEVSPFITQSMVLATAVGTADETSLISGEEIQAGQEIVLCGFVGLEGMLRILDEKEQELKKRFVPAFINQMKALQPLLTPLEAISAAAGSGVTALYQIGSGGILAALWELGETAKTGMELDMTQMSVKQATIEVCEYYRLNPYQMTSAGTILMVTRDAKKLTGILEQAGARAARLGITTDGKARVITSGTEKRFLDRPAQDELMRWQIEKQ